jgi:hypothetical protein
MRRSRGGSTIAATGRLTTPLVRSGCCVVGIEVSVSPSFDTSRIGDRRGVAMAQLGDVALDEHDLDRAETLLQQALGAHLQLQDRRGAGAALG